MSTDPTLASRETETVIPAPGEAAESAQLDAAIRQADDLLLQSLRSAERRRRRRRLRWLVLPMGGFIMLALAYVLMLALAAPPAATSPPGDEPPMSAAQKLDRGAQLAQEGWQLWNQRQFGDAETKFQEAVKLAPSLANAWNGLGWSQLNQGKSDEADKAFQKAVELEPDHAGAENGLGIIAFQKRSYDKAEQHWLASAQTPGATAAWYGLAKLYLLRAQWDKAAEYAQKIVDSGDTGGQPLLDAAKAKKLSPALKQESAPPAPPAAPKVGNGATLQQGWALLNRGQANQAIDVFKVLLEKNPNDASVLNGLGWAYLRSGKSAEAKDAFQKAIKADPNAAGSMNGLAIVLKNEGKVDEAVKLWEEMLGKFPGPNAATFGLASVYMERKQYDKARPLLEELSKSDPSNPDIQRMLAEAKSK